ncbi:MAG: DUF3737 family protein [Butyrivibrio sp.]|nr:DUF3737 family protein [Butyrivibrio sp.]
MNNIIENKQFDEERALYNLTDAEVRKCTFAGPADGESALKEARNVKVEECSFSLRYPLWHVTDFEVNNSSMDELTRAAFWYDKNGRINDSKLGGTKALRECSDIAIENSDIVSEEFGWKCNNISMKDTRVESMYLFLDSKNIKLENVEMKGKYSFQYVENMEISNCNFDTKDAFWHTKNVTVRDSVIKGEYLAWYSEGLTLIDCKLIGTQPLCYCKNLKLINCTMEECDLSFEYSDVDADIVGSIDSVKNPKSGKIVADAVGEIITEAPVIECSGEVIIR